VYIVFKKHIAMCTHTHTHERERMREKAFVQYLFTATSISKYRKRSKHK
jgi:hypothetical protein